MRVLTESRVVLITGASRGIGAATARHLAQAGWTVVINYLARHDCARAVLADVQQAGAAGCTVQADVSKPADIGRLFAHIDAEYGRLDALVNNAGIVDQVSRLQDMRPERIARMLQINVAGPMLCAAAAIPRMSVLSGGRGGAIVNISSKAAAIGSSNQYLDYAASKGAIDTFTLGLAQELAADGIRVNAVRPGIIDTDIHASGGQPHKATRSAATIPLGRAGNADDIAQGVVYLLSDAALYITGSLLDITGGR